MARRKMLLRPKKNQGLPPHENLPKVTAKLRQRLEGGIRKQAPKGL